MNHLYQAAKRVVRSILPTHLLYQYELPLRKLFALGYRGKAVQCNLCQSELSGFIRLETGDLLCPVCGSLPRHRRLWFLLEERPLNGKVLHFSPARPLWRLFRQLPGIEYIPSDYEPNPLIQKRLDITKIDLPDQGLDHVLCYHVLEHIEDDQKAMTELYRVLRTGGQLLVQTPFKEGAIYEDFSIREPADRLRHFGQEDHVRVYSVEGLKKRLEKAGFEVTVLQFENEEKNVRFGLSPEEKILVCKRK